MMRMLYEDETRKMVSGHQCTVFRDRYIQWIESDDLGVYEGEPYRVVQHAGRITLYQGIQVIILQDDVRYWMEFEDLLELGLENRK